MAVSSKKPAHRPSRRPLILRAALEEFGAAGVQGGELASISPIAERASVTAAAMYYHFKSKSDLMVALIEFTEPSIVALCDEAVTAHGPQAWASSLIELFGQWVREDPLAARFYFITAQSVAADEVRTAYERSQNDLTARLIGEFRHFCPDLDELTLWTRAIAVLALLHEMVVTALQDRLRVGRGFAAIERSARAIACSMVCEV